LLWFSWLLPFSRTKSKFTPALERTSLTTWKTRDWSAQFLIRPALPVKLGPGDRTKPAPDTKCFALYPIHLTKMNEPPREEATNGETNMIGKLCAVVLLSLALAACESNPTETNANANNAAKTAPSQVSPAPAASPLVEPTSAAKPQARAGDKVRVAINGTLTDATVVSIDEKTGKAVVKLAGLGGEKTVAIEELVRD